MNENNIIDDTKLGDCLLVERQSEVDISVPKRFELYESEVIFSKYDVILSKHSFIFKYDQQLKKVYALHAIDFHKTMGGLQGETLIETMKPHEPEQVKISTASPTTKSVHTKQVIDSVKPELLATISQLERKVEKTYEELIEALLNPSSSMTKIMEIFETLLKENLDLKNVDSKNLKLEVLMSGKIDEENIGSFRPDVQKKVTIEDYDEYFIMKEKEPHMEDYVQKTYIKAKEILSTEKSSEEEFLQDIWKDKVRETTELIAKRRYDQIMFIKKEMQKVAAITTDGEEEQEVGDAKSGVRVGRIVTIKNQLQEIIHGIKQLTESIGEAVNFDEKKEAILKETEKAFDEYLTIKLENVRTQNEDILVSQQMETVSDEKDEMISKKIPVFSKKMKKIDDIQSIVEDGKSDRKRRPSKSKDKRIPESDSTILYEIQGDLDKEVGQIFLDSKKFDPIKSFEMETVQRVDDGLPILPQVSASDRTETPIKISLQPQEIKDRLTSPYSSGKMSEKKRKNDEQIKTTEQDETEDRIYEKTTDIRLVENVEPYSEKPDVIDSKVLMDEKDKELKLKNKSTQRSKVVYIHSEDVPPTTPKKASTRLTENLLMPVEFKGDNYSIDTEKQKQYIDKKIPTKEKPSSIESKNSSEGEIKQSLSEKRIMAEVSRRLQVERERKYANVEMPDNNNPKTYLKNKIGHLLIPGLVDILRKRPTDPCDYLRNYITENKDKVKRKQDIRKKQEQLHEKKSLLIEIQKELHERMVNQKTQLKILDVLQMDDESDQQTTIQDILAIMTESDINAAFDND